jgi:hypothetical protein
MRKLSVVAADTMQVKEKHYEKVGEDVEQITRSYQTVVNIDEMISLIEQKNVWRQPNVKGKILA